MRTYIHRMVFTTNCSIVRRMVFLALLNLPFLAAGCGTMTPVATPPGPTVSLCQPRDEVAFSSWRGLVPGHTREDKIVPLLGEPHNVTPYRDDISVVASVFAYHYYPRPGRCAFYTVAVQDGLVHSTTEAAWEGSLSSTLYGDLVGAGCEPVVLEQMISSNPVHAYPELGVAFEVGEGGAVLAERHFAPQSRAEYLVGWEGLGLRLDPVLNYAHALERLGFQPGVTSQTEVEERLQPWTAVNGARTGSVSTEESLSGLPELVFYLGPDRTFREYPPKGVAWITFREGVVLTTGFNAPLVPPCLDGHIPAYEGIFGDFYTLGDALREHGEPALAFVTECPDGMLQDLRLVYPRQGRQIAVLAELCTTAHYYCVLWNSSATARLHFPLMSEEEFREQLRLIWNDEFRKDGEFIGCPYREVQWQDIAPLCEVEIWARCWNP